ncbi:hypothetical protein CASFOL_011447 [Castilleja foliolosa]|uniref:Helitron helicase-like domain-containing protein n=1 Tax=Castilleja foliolosa TaxID=1961234 RepID=A0ABD3DXB7_9LAMI
MTGKRGLNATTYEVGESSRPRRSRRMSQLMASGLDDAVLPPYNYLDNGDCDRICEHCAALFWYAERVVCGSTLLSPKYTHCCKRGAVRLPLPLRPPDVIRQMFENDVFMDNIRAYNNMFSMTSLGAQIDDAVNDGWGPYVFKVSGQICHWIGSLCPPDNQRPRFLQMYIYDTNNEVSNRMRFFNSSDRNSLSEVVVQNLSEMLGLCNEYVRLFRNAIDRCDAPVESDFSIRLYNDVGDRRYAPPAPGTLGGIVRADDLSASGYDIVVHRKDGTPHRVSKLHPSYMPLQYPLLFPFAEQGWSPTLTLHSVSGIAARRLTVNMYFSYQIQDRDGMYALLLRGGRLLQQYLVDAYTCIEQNRLDYINANQNIFRSDFVAGLYDALARGDTNVNDTGKRIFLPSSFTGGPRYMYKHYQDALAICRVHGNPQYFITFTCNVKWPEISRHMTRVGAGHAQNRHDIIARVFHIKVVEFFKFLRSDKPFGEVAAVVLICCTPLGLLCYAFGITAVGIPVMIYETLPMSCLRVRDIRERETPAPIEIRVLKKWITKGKREEICYQFVDTYGDCIEASAELRHIEHFDAIIRLGSCYKVSEYVCVGPRTYMATVDHGASLVIGQRATFTSIPGSDLPTVHFNFADYDTLRGRIKNPKSLTDYIGRVEKNSLRTTGTGKTLRKTLLRDESGHQIEITLWPDARHLIGDEVVPGDIVAITSTTVTEHNIINPELPQTEAHVNRLKTLPATQETRTDEKMVTIEDLVPNNLVAHASLKTCHNLQPLRKLIAKHEYHHLVISLAGLIFVCKDDADVTPNFRYSVNARITDDTGAADAVFFNDSMYAMLQISCDDMVTKHGETDPRKFPRLLQSILNTPWLLHVAQKLDGIIVVNDVTKITSPSDHEADIPRAETSTLTPTTPIPKKTASKRQEALTLDASDRRKAKKA